MSKRDKAISEFFEHHIRYYRNEADKCRREANKWLCVLGIILIILFFSCI